MRKFFQIKSLKHLVLGVLLNLILINLLTVSSIFSVFSNQGVAIDVSGRNRMLSQRMVLFANLYIQSESLQDKELCLAAKNMHDASILALKHGGDAPGMPGKTLQAVRGQALDYLSRVEDLWEKYRYHLEVILNEPELYKKQRGKPRELKPQVAESVNFLRTNVTAMLNTNNDLVKALVRQSKAGEHKIYIFLFICTLLSFMAWGLAYYLLNLHFFKPMDKVMGVANKVAMGDYEQSLEVAGEHEFGKLAQKMNILLRKFREASVLVKHMGQDNLNYRVNLPEEEISQDSFIKSLYHTQEQLKTTKINTQNRSWINEGIAKFGELLQREDTSTKDLARLFLSQLIPHTEATMGAIFMLSEPSKDPHLSMLACYAYDRVRLFQHRVEIGEGLLGETYQENKINYLLDVPEGYTEISSGLGKEKPRSIMMIPLQNNQEMLGVMEIASLNTLEDYKREFLIKISEVLASTLTSRSKSDETMQLYEAAQEMTETLQATEEEMRQNMEELQATQEEMQRKEAEYLDIISRYRGENKGATEGAGPEINLEVTSNN